MWEPPASGIQYQLTLRGWCRCTCSRRRTSDTARPRCSPLRRIQDREQTRDATSISRNWCSSRGPTWSTRSYSTRNKNQRSELWSWSVFGRLRDPASALVSDCKCKSYIYNFCPNFHTGTGTPHKALVILFSLELSNFAKERKIVFEKRISVEVNQV